MAREFSIVKGNYQKSLPLIESLQNEKTKLCLEASDFENKTVRLNQELANLEQEVGSLSEKSSQQQTKVDKLQSDLRREKVENDRMN